MSVPNDQLERAVQTARVFEQEGYFERVRAGDQKAAALFVQLVALDLNPTGKPADWGWLTKSPGETQVDGFAEDAICWTNDPNNRVNAVDMINGAGAPGASIGGSVKERRENNKWFKPEPLSPEELAYLRSGGAPPQPHPPQPPVTVTVPGREEALDEMKWLDAYYAAPEGLQRPNGLSLGGKPDFEGIAAWYLDVYQQERIKGKSRADARAAYVNQIRHSNEWKQKHPGETP